MDRYDVIVIGGGAAGMMAAGRAAECGKRVLLLEKNAALGKKLSISGGGRCNILNAEDDVHKLLAHYGKSGKFLASPFAQFGMRDAYRFFESRGLPFKVEARKRAFPQSEKASDVVVTLKKYMEEGNVEVRLRAPVQDIKVADGRIAAVVAGGQMYIGQAYVLATGGLSHPETGSTGDGFTWLEASGHTIHAPTPTIVPLRTNDTWSHTFAGITISQAKITFFVEGKKAFAEKGSILLTHFGISGPTILNAAGKVADLLQEGEVTARIDCYPDLDLGILDRKITETFDDNKNKLLKNVFAELAPKGTGSVLLTLLPELDGEKRVHSITKEERRKLGELLKALPITITGLMGFDRAVVADGGVPLTEIDTKTFRSLKVENLFIVGDLLHIRRPSGGYSLQLAWTSGYVAGTNA